MMHRVCKPPELWHLGGSGSRIGGHPDPQAVFRNFHLSNLLEQVAVGVYDGVLNVTDAPGLYTINLYRCLGTTQHLKSKYGGGYILEVKLNPGQAYYSMDHASGQAAQLLNQHLSALDQTIRQVFPAVELTETFGERVTYRIPKDGVTSLSEVFKAMEEGMTIAWYDVIFSATRKLFPKKICASEI